MLKHHKQAISLGVISFKICIFLIFVAIATLSSWIVINAETWQMQCVGSEVLLAGCLLIVAVFKKRVRFVQKPTFGFSILILLFIISGLVVLNAPNGQPPSESPVKHRFYTGLTFHRYVLSNIAPEIDQIWLGFKVMPYLDPLLTSEQSQRALTPTLQHYRRMRKNQNFRQLGSVLNLSCHEIFTGKRTKGHYYLYIPVTNNHLSRPMIVFLHGAGGNFKIYTYILSKLADQLGFIVIAPSFGYTGYWDTQTGEESILEAIDDAANQSAADRRNIYLVGLSNGGLGVTRMAEKYPDYFAGLVYISPVIVRSERLIKWRRRPILIVTGARDRRIPVEKIKSIASFWRNCGVDLTLKINQSADHFMVFTQTASLLADLKDWIRGIEKKRKSRY